MRRFFGKLYVQVLIGAIAGVALGITSPSLGIDAKPLGDAFIKLIKTVFAPIIFAMVVLGIARMVNMMELGRVGARALIDLDVLSTVVIARWVGAVDRERLARVLDGQADPQDLHALDAVAPDGEAANVHHIATARVAA